MCHFCHEKQAVRKGIKCSKCSVFFCFRGLYRHFDIDLIAVLSNKDSWNCPKCLQKASGSGSRVKQPYKSKSKFLTPCARPVDPRGNISGFLDDIFENGKGDRHAIANISLRATTSHRERKLPKVASNGDCSDHRQRSDTNAHGSAQVYERTESSRIYTNGANAATGAPPMRKIITLRYGRRANSSQSIQQNSSGDVEVHGSCTRGKYTCPGEEAGLTPLIC